MIEFRDVYKEYPDGTHALNGVSFTIQDGEFLFLIGPSGAGKSTVEKLIWREETPTSGQVLVDGVDVTEIPKNQIPFLRRKIGVVFQDYRLLSQKNVFENIAFAMEVVGAPDALIQKRVPVVLEIVGLQSRANSFPNELSGGEQQRVALARAIVNTPKLLIADEPTGNLDPKNTVEMMKILKLLNQKGTTVIVTTHDRALVNVMNRRVIELHKGRIVRDELNGGYGHGEA